MCFDSAFMFGWVHVPFRIRDLLANWSHAVNTSEAWTGWCMYSFLSWFTCPFCFCFGSFLSGVPGASLLLSCSSFPHHRTSTRALSLLPAVARSSAFLTVNDPVSLPFLRACLLPVGPASLFPAAYNGLCLSSLGQLPSWPSPRQLLGAAPRSLLPIGSASLFPAACHGPCPFFWLFPTTSWTSGLFPLAFCHGHLLFSPVWLFFFNKLEPLRVLGVGLGCYSATQQQDS